MSDGTAVDSDLRAWLDEAERLLAIEVGQAVSLGDGFGDVDRHVERGLQFEPSTIAAEHAPTAGDLAALRRVLAALTDRQAVAASELADVTRRRAELTRARRGMSGYLTGIATIR